KLLPGLPARIERSGHLRPAERAIRQQASVFTRKRNTLRNALVDNAIADLGEPVHIPFARTVVATLDGIVEQAVDGVAVIRIILSGVNSTLRRNTMRAARGVLNTEGLNVVAKLREGR